jgi:hypothetical protein
VVAALTGVIFRSLGDNAAVDSGQPARVPFDAGQYVRQSGEGPCFACSMLAALTAERGVLDVGQAALARAIRSHL